MGMTLQLMSIALVALVAIGTPASSVRAAQCCGDCNSNGMVSIDELVSSVNNDLGGCILPLDLRQAFLGSTDVQSCAAKIVAAGFTAGEVETTAAVDSACDASSCDGSVLAIQHFGSPSGEGRSVVAVVTFHLAGSQPTSVQVVNIPPFNSCAP